MRPAVTTGWTNLPRKDRHPRCREPCAPPDTGEVDLACPGFGQQNDSEQRQGWPHKRTCAVARAAATLSGPRKWIATAVPSGMRSMEARKAMVINPVATPSPRSTGTSGRRSVRNGGRAMARKMGAQCPHTESGPGSSGRPQAAIRWRILSASYFRGHAGGYQTTGDPDAWTEPGQVGDQVLDRGVERLVGEQRGGGVLAELGAACLAPVPAPAGHAAVIAPHPLAGFELNPRSFGAFSKEGAKRGGPRMRYSGQPWTPA